MACNKTLRTLALGLVLVAGSACAKEPSSDLPRLKLDPQRVAVVGLSSGAYMATQAQLAYPDVFPNAAIVAGGPYGCAQGKLDLALTTCMKGTPAPDVAALVDSALARAKKGQIGPLKDLAEGHVYLLHGLHDGVVAPDVAEAGAEFYRQLSAADAGMAGLQITDDGKRPFGHNLPVAGKGDDCDSSTSPYLGHCDFDAAGAIFAKMFGPAPAPVDLVHGKVLGFDQDALRPDGKDAFLAKQGYLYLPPACAAGKRCGLVVALHGCKQNAEAIGRAFVDDAGFNRWADAYDVAVLYPQTRASFAPLNPQACWDWWGYSGSNYDTRQGVQLRWLVDAVRALGLPAKR